jgi:fermentation-respiration switch protein FrsA (DUF1100 family)
VTAECLPVGPTASSPDLSADPLAFDGTVRAGTPDAPSMSDLSAVGDLAAGWATARTGWGASLYRDGRRLAYISDRSGSPRLWLTRIPDSGPIKPGRMLPTGPGHVDGLSWSADGSWIAALLAPGGGTRTRVEIVRPTGSERRRVAGVRQGAAALGPWGATGSVLALATTGRRPEDTSSRLLNVDTGESTGIAYGKSFNVLDLSRDGRRALLRTGARGARRLVVVDLDSQRHRLLGDVEESRGRSEQPSSSALGSIEEGVFGPGGHTVFARSDVGRDCSALVVYRLDRRLRRAEGTVLRERPDAELDTFRLSADGATLVLVWNVDGRSELEIMRPAEGISHQLSELPVEVVESVTMNVDASRLVICGSSPRRQRTVWVLDGAFANLGRPSTQASASPGNIWRPVGADPVQATDRLVEPIREQVTGHDGLILDGWLYPAAGSRRDGGVGTGQSAMIYLHGGPEAQERPDFSPYLQGLAAAGVTVLAPNVRGSTGYGRDFRCKDDLTGRFDAIEDVASCARHLISQGWAEPGCLGCMGRSYGGYLTLAALVHQPGLFAAGVDICGMADLETFYEHTEPWIASAARSKYGDPDNDRELLRDLSPLHRFDRLQAPLLVVHGQNDRNVPLFEAQQVVAAARARGIPVRQLIFADEGHDYARVANRELLTRTLVSWVPAALAGSGASAASQVG